MKKTIMRILTNAKTQENSIGNILSLTKNLFIQAVASKQLTAAVGICPSHFPNHSFYGLLNTSRKARLHTTLAWNPYMCSLFPHNPTYIK